jgi:putative ABC transport system ATP-binding protein
MITITNLTKTFHTGEHTLVALDHLSFVINDGEFLAITGRSGAGKSTLLYQLSLLDRPTSGELLIDGQNTAPMHIAERVAYRRNHFGFIFQDYALLPSLTALENVMLPLLMQGTPRHDAQEKAQQALKQVELEEKYENLPSQLSGGQQQRVSIARSIVHQPKILFADEPTANLDTESSKTILDIFLTLNKKEKLTIVMVTHERDYAQLAARNIVLSDGKITHDTRSKKS